MSEIKTRQNDASVEDFLNAVDDPKKRADGHALLEIFKQITKEQPKMWGASIVGFGQYHYKSERSSQEGDWMLTGFSPRKANLTLYILSGPDKYPKLLDTLGKHKLGKGCLYINKLADVDLAVMKELITRSYQDMKREHAQ